MQGKATIGIEGRIKLELLNEKGEKVQLWNENKLGKFLRKLFSSIGFDYLGKFGIRLPGFGSWQMSLEQHNLFVNAGKAALAGLMGNTGSVTAFGYLAVGVGTTAADATDTTLETEITDSGMARAATTNSRVTTSVTNDTLRMIKTWSVSGTKAVTEIGAFNASSAGDMAGRSVFSAINVVSGYTLIGTYDFQMSV